MQFWTALCCGKPANEPDGWVLPKWNDGFIGWYHSPIPTFTRFDENPHRRKIYGTKHKLQAATRGCMSLRRMWMVNLPGSRRRAMRLWMGMFSLNVGCWYANRPWRRRHIYR